MKDEKVVMIDDPEIAVERMVTMWCTKDGGVHPNEHSARYHACTHRRCPACGAPAPKHYMTCDACREKLAAERFAEQPAAEWTEGPLFSDSLNEYFDDPADALDYAAGDGVTLETMRLELCKRVYPRELTPDYFDDVPGEDANGNEIPFPPVLEAAIKTFNAFAKVHCGWESSGVRWDYTRQGGANE